MIRCLVFFCLFLSHPQILRIDLHYREFIVWRSNPLLWVTWVLPQTCLHFDPPTKRSTIFRIIRHLCHNKKHQVWLSQYRRTTTHPFSRFFKIQCIDIPSQTARCPLEATIQPIAIDTQAGHRAFWLEKKILIVAKPTHASESRWRPWVEKVEYLILRQNRRRLSGFPLDKWTHLKSLIVDRFPHPHLQTSVPILNPHIWGHLRLKGTTQ